MILRLLAILTAVLVGTAVGVSALVYWAGREMDAPGPLAQDQAIVIPSGAGLNQVTQILSAAGALKHPGVFRIMARLQGQAGKLRAGEYMVPAHASKNEILELLVSGDVIHHRLTLPEGLTSYQVVELLRQIPNLSGEITEVPEEGSLLPETYVYVRGDSRAKLLARMAAAMDKVLQEAWANRDMSIPLQSPREALTLASIVEKETAIPEERPRIAAVFLNRLRLGMRLQSDPTVIYGLTAGQGPLQRRLLSADLKHDSPYNTYVISGLPQGPIANPGRDSILAVTRPIESKELYFVADGTGGHAFARTLDEHNRNVAKWRRIRKAQGN
jgi:UPF0755 protein